MSVEAQATEGEDDQDVDFDFIPEPLVKGSRLDWVPNSKGGLTATRASSTKENAALAFESLHFAGKLIRVKIASILDFDVFEGEKSHAHI